MKIKNQLLVLLCLCMIGSVYSQNELNNIPYLKYNLDNNEMAKAKLYREKYDLPANFPAFDIIKSAKPAGGYYFLARMTQNPQIPFYLIIMDTLGFPVFYREFQLPNAVSDFSFNEETGYLTYFAGEENVYKSLDSSYQINNVYAAKNGYLADGHEVRLREDGSYWVLIYDDQIVDMSQIVPGGQVDATVTGLILQHIDNQGNVIFEWNSRNHIPITDADPAIVNLLANGIDYVHGNALDFDYDGNLLLSSRNLSEITKINSLTGDIMWRLGGSHNQFEIIGDSVMFSAQHHIRYIGNDKYSFFDNGFGRNLKFSRGLTFELDTVNMTASLVRDLNHFDSLVFSPFMGGNTMGQSNETVIGWSINNQRYVLTEYDSLDNISLEIRSLDTLGFVSYRAGKHFWQTNAISFDQDEYYMDQINIDETSVLDFDITNNTSSDFNLNGYNSSDAEFTLVDELPITMASGETKILQILFSPDEEKKYSAAISFYTDNQTERTAKQFRVNTALVLGADNNVSKNNIIKFSYNPRLAILNLATKEGLINKVAIFDMSGRLVYRLDNMHKNHMDIIVKSFKSGLYIVNIQLGNNVVSRKFIK